MLHNGDMLQPMGPQKSPLKRPDPLQQQKIQQAVQQAAQHKLAEQGQHNQSLPQSEQVALSKEITEDFESQGDHQGMDALMASLGNQPKVDQKIEEKVKEVGGSAQVQNKPGQPKPQKVTAEWKPDTEKGKLHKAHEKIGDVRLTAKTKSPDSKEQPPSGVAAVQASHTRPGTKGAPKTDAPRPVGQVEASKSPKPDTKVGNRLFPRNNPPQDKVELSPESRKQLQAGNPQVARDAEQKAQQASHKLGQGEQDTDLGTVEVKTKADSWSQTAAARPAGEVKDGDPLRWYQRLDGISNELLESIRALQGNTVEAVKERGSRLGLRPEEQQKLQQPQAILQ
jgi:hypothetical protein